MTDKDLKRRVSELEAELKKLKHSRLGLVFEDKTEDVVERSRVQVPVLKEIVSNRIDLDPDYPNNLMIEGDNYLALSVLNYTHKKCIDLIYIDPPYNSGAKNWKYNNDFVDKDDAYRHSKWLSFMRHRLTLAKGLLKDDGVLICAVDHNEQAHLGVMLDTIFPTFETVCVTVIHNPGGIQGDNFSYTHEYAYFIFPQGSKPISRVDRDDTGATPFRDWGGDESKRDAARNCFYPVIVKDGEITGFGDVAPDDYHPAAANEKREDGSILVWPIDGSGVERKWRFARQTVEAILGELRCEVNRTGEAVVNRYKSQYRYKTVWTDSKYNANTFGTKLLRELLPQCDFNFPKSLYTVFDCLMTVARHRPHATILDFFAGSGTTGHAVLEMNKRDGGSRRFILCTNNENNNGGDGGIAETVCYPRIKAVIKGYPRVKREVIELYRKAITWALLKDPQSILAEVTSIEQQHAARFDKLETKVTDGHVIVSGLSDKAGTKDGIPSNLFYYRTDLVDVEQIEKVPDDARIRITYEAGTMIAVRENTLVETSRNDCWQIFEGNGKLTAIYFKEDKSQLADLISLLEARSLPTAVYIFSWGKNEYKGDYTTDNVRVEDIPEPILEVYKELNRI